MSLSEILSDYIVGTSFSDIPGETISNVQKLLLDHLGVSAMGAQTPWGQIVKRVASRAGGATESTAYFSDGRIPATSAALINGTYAHSFEFDDRLFKTHPGCVVIPAALAAAELRGNVSGAELLTAIVLGYEIVGRVALAMDNDARPMMSSGHHPTGCLGQFGAATAAAKVLGLSRHKLVSTIGLAGNFATGVCEFYRGSMEKRIFAGRASESGVLACLLAEDGFTGPPEIFEGEYGFCNTYAATSYPERLVDSLGSTFKVDQVSIKRYSCCGGVIDWIGAAASAHNAYPSLSASPHQISSVLIESGEDSLGPLLVKTDVNSAMSAQYSVPYGVAIALLKGEPGWRDFTEAGYRDPDVQDVLSRCTVVRHRSRNGKGPITVTLKSGEAIVLDVPRSRDHVGEITSEMIKHKFFDVTSAILDPRDAQLIASLVEQIAEAPDISMLTEALRGARARSVPGLSRLS